MGGKVMALGVLILAVFAVFGLSGDWVKAGWILAGVGATLVLFDK